MPLGEGDRDILVLLIVAICTRLAGVALTSLTEINSYVGSDATGFARTGAHLANGLQSGIVSFPEGVSYTYRTWGGMLSPFWLLPGPSRTYARIAVALLSIIAIYNVYVITRSIGSRRAAAFAITPMLFYPSFIFVHSAIIREAAVLFGLTTAARLLVAPGPRLSGPTRSGLATIALVFATMLRTENLPVYVAVLAIAIAVKYRHAVANWVIYYLGSAVLVLGTLVAFPRMQRAMDALVRLRRARAKGRTEYLGWVMPDTVLEAVAFSGIGAVYFLFTPFPWMIEQMADFVAAMEAVGNLVFAVAAIFGARTVIERNVHVGVALVSGIVLGVTFYGLGTVNVGTAVRHRQMVLWAIFLLGGIGIAERIRITASTPERRTSDSPHSDQPMIQTSGASPGPPEGDDQ